MAGYNNLKGELRRRNLTQQDVADALGIRRATANLKINGKVPFVLNEAFKLWRLLFSDCDFVYLFNEYDQSA